MRFSTTPSSSNDKPKSSAPQEPCRCLRSWHALPGTGQAIGPGLALIAVALPQLAALLHFLRGTGLGDQGI